MVLSALLFLLLGTAPEPAPQLGAVPSDTVRVFLVRHGQAYSNLDPAPDLPAEQLDRLTELGRQQVGAASGFLAGQAIAAVVTSPAARARETAGAIGAALGLAEPRVDPALRPLELGRAADDSPLDWDARIAEWEAGRDAPVAGGETLEQVGERVLAAVRSLRADYAGKSVVLVAHSEVIGAFLGALRGTPGAARWPPQIRNGSLTAVDAGPQGPPRLRLADYVPPDPHAGAP
jgi:probable phosphoglycerate mutase